MDLRQREPDRWLPAIGRGRRRRLLHRVDPADSREVGARRPVDTATDPGLEPGLCPVLAGQDAGRGEPAGPVRGVADLPAVPAGAGCEGRPRCRDLLPARARVRRSAHRRRRRRRREGRLPQLLQGRRPGSPDGPGAAGPACVRRREGRARHRDLPRRRSPARARLLAARGAGRAGRRTLARVTGPAHGRGLPGGRAGPLPALARSPLLAPAVGVPPGRDPAGRLRRARHAVHRGPMARHAHRHRADGSHQPVILRGAAGGLARAVRRRDAGQPPRGHDRPPAAEPRPAPRRGLSAVRDPVRVPPADHADDQPEVLPRALRRQLLHRPLPAVPRIPAVPRGAERVELRHRGQARQPVPERDRQRNGVCQRDIDRQRQLHEHVVPRVPDVHRGPELPRQRHRLPAAGQDGRELPPRDEGPGADHGDGPGGRRAPWIAELRDPPNGAA